MPIIAGLEIRGPEPRPPKPPPRVVRRIKHLDARSAAWIISRCLDMETATRPTYDYPTIARNARRRIGVILTPAAIRRLLQANDPQAYALRAAAFRKLREDALKRRVRKAGKQHWLAAAYERVKAGEPETDVLREYGYVAVPVDETARG